MDISKQEVDMSTAQLGNPPDVGADGVSPEVLAAVILGVLFVIGAMFSLAVLIDRRSRRLQSSRGARISGRLRKTAILNNMCPSAETDPPSVASLGPDNC